MTLHLGVKSDPIESRYSFDWLFDLMKGCGVHRLQMGTLVPGLLRGGRSFPRTAALGGGTRDPDHQHVHIPPGARVRQRRSAARRCRRRGWERMIHVAALVGAECVGSNACVVLRDQPADPGARACGPSSQNMKELLGIAHGRRG